MKTASELQRIVQDELKWEPSLHAGEIGVSAIDGVVTLTGHVKSYADKRTAERAAKRVLGVHGVANDLAVKLPATAMRDDTDLTLAALNALKWHTTVPDDRVTVSVSNGWITLEGAVDWYYQKDSAYRAVRDLTGVNGVTNRITLTPHASALQVKDKIEAAFQRSALVGARRKRCGQQAPHRGRVRGLHLSLMGRPSASTADGRRHRHSTTTDRARTPYPGPLRGTSPPGSTMSFGLDSAVSTIRRHSRTSSTWIAKLRSSSEPLIITYRSSSPCEEPSRRKASVWLSGLRSGTASVPCQWTSSRQKRLRHSEGCDFRKAIIPRKKRWMSACSSSPLQSSQFVSLSWLYGLLLPHCVWRNSSPARSIGVPFARRRRQQ